MAAPATVRMKVPDAGSTIAQIDGREYEVGADGTIEVPLHYLSMLLDNGFVPVTAVPLVGAPCATAGRPASPVVGFSVFDTDLGFQVWWNGAGWVNAAGANPDQA